jgi:hypothetical protein
MTVVVLWVSGNFSVVAREDLKYKSLKKDTHRRLHCEEIQGTRVKPCSCV